MTDRAVLEELKRILGGGIYNNRPAEYVTNAGQHTKALYRWRGEWRQALKAAQKLLPHVVGEKRQKLQEIIDYYEKRDRKKDVE